MKSLQSRILFLFGSFLFGGLSTYLAMDFMDMKNKLRQQDLTVSDNRSLNTMKPATLVRDQFSDIDQFHRAMRRNMENAFSGDIFGSNFFSSNMFDTDFSNMNLSGGFEVIEREDDEFKYIEVITDVEDKDSIDVNVSNGVISISGEFRKIDDTQGINSRSMSSYISQSSRTLNVPYGVIEEDVKIVTNDNKIILKFPKDKI